MEENQKRYDSINIMRMICAFLVISLHTSIFASINLGLNSIVTKGISRIAVPFFFISTGYFMVRNINKSGYIKNFVKKMSLIYLIISVIDILLIMPYVSERLKGSFIDKIKFIFIGGITESLWYIPAIVFAVVLVGIFLKKDWIKGLISLSILVYIIGLLGDSYFGIIKNTSIEGVINIYNNIFINTRNGITFSVPFVTLGALIAKGVIKIRKKYINIYLIGFSILFVVEACLLNLNNIPIDTNMYISLVLLVPVIFVWLLNMNVQISERTSNILREMSLWVYCVHETIMIALMIYGKFTTTMMRFLIVSLLSTFIAYLIAIKKVKMPSVSVKKERAVLASLLALSVVFLFINNSSKNAQSAYKPKDAFNLDGEPTEVVGPLYKVSDENSSIYIYQSYLFGSEDMYPLNSVVQEAVKSSEAIVFEIGNFKEGDNRILELGVYPSEDSIENHLSKEAVDIIKESCSDINLGFDLVKGYSAPIINQTIQLYNLGKYSTLAQNSSQLYLSALASEYNKEQIYMNDTFEYYKKFISMGESVGEELSKLTKYYKDINEDSIRKAIELWKNGDAEALNKYDYIFESLDDNDKEEYAKLNNVYKKAFEKYINEQEDIYIKKIKEYMNEDKNYFIVFAEAPLTGENGLLEKLAQEGYKIDKE